MDSRTWPRRRALLSELHQDPQNARTHDERNIESIVGSLRQFGQVEPLVVQAGTGLVVGGNGRVEAMRRLGWAECDVTEVELSDAEARALGLALNRTAELADWDAQALADALESIRAEDGALLLATGFDDDEVDELLDRLASEKAEAAIQDMAEGAKEFDVPKQGIVPPGYKSLVVVLLDADEEAVREAIRVAKAVRGLSTTPEALAAIAREYLETHKDA